MSKIPHRKNFTWKGDSPNGLGTEGKKIALKANFFPVDLTKLKNIYHYDIKVISPKAPERELPKKLNAEIVDKFMKDYRNNIFKGISFAYDGKCNIYTSKKVGMIPDSVKKTYELEYAKPGGRGSENFVVQIQYAQEIVVSNIPAALAGRQQLDNTVIQAIDIVLMQGFKLNDGFTNVGRNFFQKQQSMAKDLGMGKEIWFGFHQSLRPCNGRMMLNIDVAATTFYKGQSLLNFAAQIVYPTRPNRNNPNPPQKPLGANLNERERKSLEKELRHVKIETRHGEYHRHYRICKLMKDTAASKKFDCHEMGTISVEKYFLQKYKIRLRYPHLPLVLMLPRDKNLTIPLELCYVIGGEHYKKKLDPRSTADMVRSCAKPAPDRAKNIDHYARTNGYERDATLNGFGIKVNPRMVAVEGRILPPRSCQYSKNRLVQPSRGSWDARNCNYYDSKTIENWAMLIAENERYCNIQKVEDFGQKLQRGAMSMGMKIKPPAVNKYVRSIHDLERGFKEAKSKGVKFIFCILGQDDSIYSKLKQLGDIEYGIHTQAMQSKNLQKADQMFIGNMLLKINAKLNGINNIVRAPGNKPLLTRPTIIIGADVTHPAPGDNAKPSVAAMVASMNSSASKYFCDIRIQHHRQETIGSMKPGEFNKRNLELATVKFLKEFHRQTNGQKPQHIIYYRDGVSEGQFQEILKEELSQLRSACSVLNASYKPKMTIIICQKRHHTRLFVQNDKDGEGRSKNVPAGTIVDTTITHPTEFDFYLCSHAGIQGTSRPCHYHCIYNDEPTMTANALQSLTYSLTHVYQRCTKSVSLPAPVYYAHLAAKQAVVHLQDLHESDNSSTFSGDSDQTFDGSKIKGMQDKVTLHQEYSKISQHYV